MQCGGIDTIKMGYEDIWQKLKAMTRNDRRQLAYEMSFKGYNVENIFPHYYHEAKAIHDIEFFEPHSQYPLSDDDGKYYNALKELIEDDSVVHIRFKRYGWLPRFINDWREGKVVKSYIGKRFNRDWPNKWYRIKPVRDITGERQRSLYIWLDYDKGVTYKMVECKTVNGVEEMAFKKMNMD